MSGRIRFSITVVGFLLLAGFAAPTAALTGDDAESSIATDYQEGEVLVRVVPDTDPELLGPGAAHLFGRWYRLPTGPMEGVIDAVERVSTASYVELAEPNRRLRLDPIRSQATEFVIPTVVTPNDPFYSYQWHLPAIDAGDAWETTDGSGVVVAIVDSGISMGGDDLDCRPLAGEYNAFTDVAAPGAATDDTNHGTHVAGTIGQCTNNGVGTAGVADGTSLLAVKVLGSSGGTTAELVKGIDWARTQGADVINMSLSSSCSPPSASVFDAIDDAIAAGIVVVASTGNDADEPGYSGTLPSPACHPGVIAVGASDFNDNRSPYSNWGNGIDVVAPGGDLGADVNGDGNPDGVLQETFSQADPSSWNYYWKQGTSMAAPHVSGTAALMIAANPSVRATQVKRALEVTAEDRGPSGWDVDYGYGLINADRAIDAVLDSEAPTWPSGSTVSVVPGDTTADLSWNAAADNIAVTDYVIWLDGSPVATTAAGSYTLTELSPATTYTVAVQAGDLMENWSAVGSPTSFTADEAVDTEKPHWGSATVTFSGVTETSARASWPSAVDDVGVTGYRVYLNGSFWTATTELLVDLTGLTAGTSYTVRIEAVDAVGNESTTGPSASFTTVNTLLPGGSFGDDNGNIHEANIEAIAAAGITKGCNPPVNDQYCPSGSVTRGQMAAFLVRALNLADSGGGNDFVDDDASIFEDDIAKLAAAGITRGCNPPVNDRFCPDALVTREQMAAFLVRALNLTDNGGGNDFVDDDASIFEDDIAKLAAAGITAGCNPPANDRFCPASPVKRDQMASFLARALHLSPIAPPQLVTVGEGIWLVPGEAPDGTYRNSDSSGGCYWARLSGFGGTLGEIITNEFTFVTDIVTIEAGDAGFESERCGTWSNDLSPRTTSTTAPFAGGAFLVGDEISAGTWRNDDSSAGCYWERVSGWSGSLGEINANSFSSSIQTVTIASSDIGFFSEGCGVWSKIG